MAHSIIRGVKKLILVLLAALPISPSAQDEAALWQMLEGGRARESLRPQKSRPVHFKARTPRYRFDIGADARKESFYFAKHDGTDWMFIHDWKGNEVFRHSLDALGGDSRAYHIRATTLSPGVRLFLVYFYEGKTHYTVLRATARLYLLTLEAGDLKTLKMAKGPLVWDEHEDGLAHYRQRQHKVFLKDLNADGVREVVVRYHLITRVLSYQGEGRWSGSGVVAN